MIFKSWKLKSDTFHTCTVEKNASYTWSYLMHLYSNCIMVFVLLFRGNLWNLHYIWLKLCMLLWSIFIISLNIHSILTKMDTNIVKYPHSHMLQWQIILCILFYSVIPNKYSYIFIFSICCCPVIILIIEHSMMNIRSNSSWYSWNSRWMRLEYL